MSDTVILPSRRMERLSLAYIRAVASHSGFDLTERNIDVDSIDGEVISTFGRRPQIGFQAKATGRDVLAEQFVSYPLSVKNYNDLRVDTVCPRILIVYVMPRDELEWLVSGEDALQLKHCAYWISLRGRPDTTNTSTVTVQLPRAQTFDCAQLKVMMGRAQNGPEI